MVTFVAVAAFLFSGWFSSADRIDTVIQHTGNDSLGSAFALALQQRMEGSTLYHFVSGAQNSMRPARVEVQLVSLNVGTPSTGLVSTVSVVAVVKCGVSPRIAHHALILVAPGNLDRMVKRSLAEMDEHIVEELNLGCQAPEPPSRSVVSATAPSAPSSDTPPSLPDSRTSFSHSRAAFGAAGSRP